MIQILGSLSESPQVSIECVSCRDNDLFNVSRYQIIKLVGSCSSGCNPTDIFNWSVICNEDSEPLTINITTTTTGNGKVVTFNLCTSYFTSES